MVLHHTRVTKYFNERRVCMSKEFYRAKEAAERLSVGLSTIWMYHKQGKLPSIKISERVTVFKKTDLDKLVE